jgi:myo-inositol-1(or 4)-monophosphatase
LDVAYVAAGRYDGCWERSVKPWDIAAGIVIAKEAGAIVEGVHPNTNPLESNDILLAGEEQFEQFSKFFRR